MFLSFFLLFYLKFRGVERKAGSRNPHPPAAIHERSTHTGEDLGLFDTVHHPPAFPPRLYTFSHSRSRSALWPDRPVSKKKKNPGRMFSSVICSSQKRRRKNKNKIWVPRFFTRSWVPATRRASSCQLCRARSRGMDKALFYVNPHQREEAKIFANSFFCKPIVMIPVERTDPHLCTIIHPASQKEKRVTYATIYITERRFAP